MGYSWLAEKKRQAMMSKLYNRGLPQYSQLPIGDKYGVSFTGYGKDGKLQPGMVAGVDNTNGNQAVFHEGETKVNTPNGSAYITSDLTKLAGLRSFATGGFDPRTSTRTVGVPDDSAVALPYIPSPATETPRYTENPITTSTQTRGVPGADTTLPSTPTTAVPDNTIMTPTIKAPTAPTIVPTTVPETIKTPVVGITPAPTIKVGNVPILSGQTTVQTPSVSTPTETIQTPTVKAPTAQPIVVGNVPEVQQQPTVDLTETPSVNPFVSGVSEQTPTATYKTPGIYVPSSYAGTPQNTPLGGQSVYTPSGLPGQGGTDYGQFATYTPTVGPDLTPASYETTPWKEEPAGTAKTPEEQARDAGLSYLQGTLTGQTGTQLAGQKALEELRLRQQQEQSALRQQATQAGFDPARAELSTRQLRARQEEEANNLAAQYGIAAEQEKVTTASSLASQGLAGQQFDLQKQQYGDSQQWQNYEAAIAAGDYNTAASVYKSMTGNDISMDNMKVYQNYINSSRQQELTSNQLNIDAQKIGVASDKMAAIINDINNGVPIDTINANYDSNLTQDDYDSIAARYQQGLISNSLAIDAQKLGVSSSTMDAIAKDINNGASLSTINATYGVNITPDEYNSIGAKYKQSLIANQLAIDSARLGITKDKMNAIIDDINNGVPLDTINSSYSTYLSDADYYSIGTRYRQSVTSGDLANDASALNITTGTLSAIIDGINSGMPLETINGAYGTKLTRAQYNSISETYNTQLASMKNALGDEQFNSVQTRISQGATYDQIKSEYPNITPDQYSSMLNASALGERDWSRKLTAANMLLATEGAANKDNASALYSQLFPGTSFDFSSIITAENNKAFSDGMSEIAGYITADMKTEDAMLALQKSGALNRMGLTSEQATQLYNGMKINAIDAQWDEMENSDFYKTLDAATQDEMKEFFRQSITGELDYDMLNEYEIKDSNGNLVSTVYGKDSSEADKYAAKYGYTVDDTGNVRFQMASTITTTPETPTTGVMEAYNRFTATLPEGVSVSYDQWNKAGGESIASYDQYSSATKSNPMLALSSITATGEDLFKEENRTKIFDAFASSPDAFRGSDFYYQSIDPSKLVGGINTTVTSGFLGSGKTVTTVSSDVKAALDSSVGKVVELPMSSGTVTGMVKSWDTTPNNVTVTLVMKDGSTKTVNIYESVYYQSGREKKVYGKEY